VAFGLTAAALGASGACAAATSAISWIAEAAIAKEYAERHGYC
jgi:hypothetical protein